MGRKIYWFAPDSSAAERAFVAQSMLQLVERLRIEVRGADIEAIPLPASYRRLISRHLNAGQLQPVIDALSDPPGLRSGDLLPRVSVYLGEPNHPAALAARRRLPHAAWGISLSGVLSLTYAPRNPYALWHETLHLLGAQDHYDPSTLQRSCTLHSCIMQYAPDDKTVGSRPMLCEQTAAIIGKACV